MLLTSKVNVPIVYALLCFPQEILHFGNLKPDGRSLGAYRWYLSRGAHEFFREWHTYRTVLSQVQGRIFASDQMLRLAKLLKLVPQNNLVLPDFLSSVFAPRRRLDRLSASNGEPHVVYIGSHIYSQNVHDDVREDLVAIANAKIHAHFAESDLSLPSHPYLHSFTPFDAEKVAKETL